MKKKTKVYIPKTELDEDGPDQQEDYDDYKEDYDEEDTEEPIDDLLESLLNKEIANEDDLVGDLESRGYKIDPSKRSKKLKWKKKVPKDTRTDLEKQICNFILGE